MGQSTDAILAYGFDLGEELPESIQAEIEAIKAEDEESEGGIDAWLDKLAGVAPWTKDRPESYWNDKKAKLAALPIDIILHCSGDYPMYFLAIRGTAVTANRGYPQKISAPKDCGDWEATLQSFCADHGIEYQDPDWHIFSMWN